MTPVPVVLVGGPLGSGKTTIVRKLLENASGQRLALIVNELGALNIDGALLAGRGADIIELSNGCVCCASGGDLGRAIARLMAGPPPDVIVVELSGAADPYPLRHEVAAMAPRAVLRRTVAVVDLEITPVDAAADPVLLRLLGVAETVVLNKRDIVGADRSAAWEGLVRATSKARTVVTATFGETPADLILGQPETASDSAPAEPARPVHSRFASATVRPGPHLDRAALAAFLSARAAVIERAKGFVRLVEGPFLVQAVRGRTTFEALPALPAGSLAGALVLISSRLGSDALAAEARALGEPARVHPPLCTPP